MRWLLSIALLASACSDPAPRDVVTPPVDAMDATAFAGGPLTYVIDRIDIDPNDDPSVPHTGFDLDNLFSDGSSYSGCYQTDFLSADETDQNCPSADDAGLCLARPNPGCRFDESGCRGGVDNQLPTMAAISRSASNFDLQSAYHDAISNHRVVLVVRITDVDDLENDSAVRVAFYRAFPTFSSGCDSLQPDRAYSVATESLANGLDIDTNAAIVLGGSIRSGRLDARGLTTPVLPLPFPAPAGYDTYNWPVRLLRLRADVTATELRRVNFGGAVDARELAEAAAGGCLSCYGKLRMVLEGLVDLQEQGTCSSDLSDRFWHGRIGIGFATHAIAARISNEVPVAMQAAPGTCGTTPTRDQ